MKNRKSALHLLQNFRRFYRYTLYSWRSILNVQGWITPRLFVQIQSRTLAPSKPKSARSSIELDKVFLQRQWVLPLPLFLSLGFTSNGWLHPASHSLTQFSLLFSSFQKRKKERKQHRTTLIRPLKSGKEKRKPFIYKEKGQAQTQNQLQLCECIWILAWVRRRKKGKKTRWTHWARGGPERVTSERGKRDKKEGKEGKRKGEKRERKLGIMWKMDDNFWWESVRSLDGIWI